MDKFKTDDPNDDKGDRNKSNDVVGVSKENYATNDSSGRADPCPYGISCTDRYRFHRLRNTKEAEDYKNNGDDAGDKSAKSLTKF